jgi:hypothetical protein
MMQEPYLAADRRRPGRRRYQFDLKHLLLVFVALAAVLGWLHQHSRLATQGEQIQELQRRIAVFEIGAILRGEMAEEQKREALALYVKAGALREDVRANFGTPSGRWAGGSGFPQWSTDLYQPFAQNRRANSHWVGNIFLVFDGQDKAVRAGYFGSLQGNGRSPAMVLDLQASATRPAPPSQR